MFHKWLQPTNAKRITFFVVFDVIITLFTIYGSFLLRFNFEIPPYFLPTLYKMALFLVLVKLFLFFSFKLYFTIWRFFGAYEYKKLLYAHLIAYSFLMAIGMSFSFFEPFPRGVVIIDFFLSMSLLSFLRFYKRLFLQKGSIGEKKTAIFGVTNRIDEILNHNEYIIKAIFDNKLAGNYFQNIRVYSEDEIKKVIEKFGIEVVILTQELPKEKLDFLIEKLSSYGVKEIKQTTLFDSKTVLKNISIEDLLARNPQDLDKNLIANFIKGKKILISGAGGSIGSELALQCEAYGAKELYLLDHSEFNLYSIDAKITKVKKVPVLQNIVEKDLLEQTFKKYKPDIVIHAAAYKHVPLVEENIQEALINNIVGTQNIIDLSIEYGVQKFIFISSDKAVRPTNVMGATKRVGELYAQNVDSKNTEIVSVRFGNVLGSSGSVIPKFQEQINKGEAITVTHPDVTRYFMLVSEACELVLQAGSIGKGGEIFILDMGEPIKIVDLAKKMILLSGRDDIEIVFSGLRKGEKLFEELLINESDASTQYESITVAKPVKYNVQQLQKDIQELLEAEAKIEKLQKIVPEFHHQTNGH